MADIHAKWSYAQKVEKELQNELAKKKDFCLVEHFDNLIQEFRTVCQQVIFLDFHFATEKNVESRLWQMHTTIKDRHKKMISASQTKEPKNVVALRKFQKRYVDFIKTSQYFYKGYIQRLASKYPAMKGLRRIAHRLQLDTLSADDLLIASPELERLVDASCHATLLRLGDLSRYRNEIRTKDRSWESALAYYSLAGNLCPDSGSSHNQMAVIALADQDHLEAVYHLYCAIAIAEPYPMAQGNLEIEFRKITAAWEKKSVSLAKLGNEATLVLLFVRLHARLYKGSVFAGHDELERTVLSRLALLLREQSFEITLEKFVIVNIAAEYHAVEKSKSANATSETHKSAAFLLQFNIRTILVLLQQLKPELDDPSVGEELPDNSDGASPAKPRERLTAVARRILPALRQYSTWLVSRSSDIAKIALDPSHCGLNLHIQEMWSTYAEVMTKVATVFPVSELTPVNYLLEEDETSVGFKPLRDPNVRAETNLYINEEATLKPRITDLGVQRNLPRIEMLSRIRDILLCTLVLVTEHKAPIELENNCAFVYFENNHLISITSPVQQSSPLQSTSNYANHDLVSPYKDLGLEYASNDSTIPSDLHYGMDTDMNRMVDNLVEPSSGRHTESNETSYGMHSTTANEIFAPLGSIVNGSQSPQQSTPKMLPSLPGIWNGPFTPQPHELLQTSPDRPSTGRLAAFQFSTSEQQLAAANSLEEITGYSASWVRNPRPATMSTSQSLIHSLQEPSSQQYMPMTMGSSAFSASSSIYANTPRGENRYGGGMNGYGVGTGNNTTTYAGASDFERVVMQQSSIWDGSQPARNSYMQTPPGGQGG